MRKRYEVVFSQDRWLVMGGGVEEELMVLESFEANRLNKQRAYEALFTLRLEERNRRKADNGGDNE